METLVKKQMIRAVVIDLDGTLLNDERKVGSKDLNTLYDLGKNNICRIIATGRSIFSFNEVLPEDFPIDYIIFAAGAGIMNFKTKEIIKTYFIPSREVKKIAENLDVLKVDFQIRNTIPDSHKYYYKRYLKKNPDFDRLNLHYKNDIKRINNFDDLPDAARFIIISPDNKIVNIIKDEFQEYSIIRASSPIDNKSVWMEIYPPNVNKGNSLKYLCKELNLRMYETVGLGNDYNDVHFLDITGKSYIVKNAPDILKKKYINTVSNNENPLTEILKSDYSDFFE